MPWYRDEGKVARWGLWGRMGPSRSGDGDQGLARLVRQIGTEAQRTFFSLYYSVPLCLCGEGLLSSGPQLIERASGVLAVALDFDFLFAVRVLAIVAAIFFVLRNYTLALRIPALLVLISHGHFPFGDDVD